ncbi:MAG: TAT-variant-translocated molybdopterin oxidoreductase, partial [Acidobacteriota bacterium]
MKDFESTIHSVAADLDDEPNGVNDAPKPGYWRSLEELAETPDFAERMQREFPRQAAELGNLDRRRFLQLSGASLGLAGLTACTKQPPEKIVPYVRQPEDIVPGKPLFFATAIPRQGFAMPVLAESHMGRPTKVDGNCEHPASKGGSDTITQASIFNLYDPDRSQAILHLGQIRTWDAFVAQLDGIRSALGAVQGEGLAIVTGSVTSPTLQRLMADLFAEMPKARHIVDEPGDESQMIEGVRQATGTPGVPIVDFTAADVVVSIDADFLSDGPSAVSYAADFATRRNARSLEDAKTMSRLYAVDSMPNGTSTSADHRLALQPSEVSRFVLALAAQLGVQGAAKPDGLDERTTAWVEEVAADLEAHRGASAVVVGAPLAPEVHAVAMAINTALGNIGSTIEVLPPQALAGEDLSDLVASIERDEVTTLLVLGANPVYTSPGDLDVAAAMDKVPLRIHLGTYIDETGERCHWHVPESHALESWGDLKGFDGTAALVQPIIQTLYDSHTAIDVVAALLGQSSISAEGHVSATWRQRHAGPDAGEFSAVDFKKAWRRALHDGMVVGTRATALDVSVDATAAVATLAEASGSDIELIFRLDPTVLDGRYANNGWLQEAPKPITLLTWDNALLMSPRTARENGFGQRIKGNEQLPKTPVGRLVVGETTVEAPVWAVPGMADGTVLLHLGYGRR